MDPAACKVIYIDDRFNTERWITREGHSTPITPRPGPQAEFGDLPTDLQANVNAILSVFNRVFVCHSGRLFSSKLSELHEAVKVDCTPIIACFDVGIESKHEQLFRSKPRFSPANESPLPSPTTLRREMTFSSESDESYGLQLLSRIASDLQVEEDSKLVIPIAIVRPKRKDSYDRNIEQAGGSMIARSPYGSETAAAKVIDISDAIDPQMMLQCLDAGALDVVRSPLDKAGIMGLTVHAYRRHKVAKKEQSAFMANARRGRKQSWVGVEEKEQPYAYLREAMVRRLLRGICEPETTIESYQHRDLYVEEHRKGTIACEVGKWSFCGHDFNEDELAYAGYCMLEHALSMPELKKWRMDQESLLHFMQGCRVAYNHFVLYHNFRHAVDVLQSVFYFLVQIGALPPFPMGSEAPPQSAQKSPIAKLVGPFEALTLLISAIGHDVGHPGVNNMFLVKLNAPLAQLYNDQSVLEAFHCAAYSQILRRHWPVVFDDKSLRRLMISSILATDMGVHADYMQQLGNLQERIHQSKTTDGWSHKDIEAFRVLTCGLLIKCADISNVARPWSVAEQWTHLLQKEFANQGEMEKAVKMETTLFGGPPELGNNLKLANGQIGFMTIFAHPLFSNVTDIIPAMGFAADEILANKGVWFTKAEQEKRREALRRESAEGSGAISPRSQSPVAPNRKPLPEETKGGYFTKSPLRHADQSDENKSSSRGAVGGGAQTKADGTTPNESRKSSLVAVAGLPNPGHESPSRRSSGAFKSGLKPPERPPLEERRSNGSSSSLRQPNESVPVENKGSGESDDQLHALASQQHHQDSIATDGANDDRRDFGTSMRAGSEQIPVLDSDPQPGKDRSQNPLSKFKFATSDEKEPVRTYDPEQNYPPIHKGARASMPVNDVGHAATIAIAQQSTSDSNVTSGGTPSMTTQATSASGGETEDRPTSSQRSEFEKQRARAASAPSPNPLIPLPSQDSTKSFRSQFGLGSRESSKNDVKATVMNGELVEGGEKDEGGMTTKERGGGTMRRRSRIRLAFWKKKKSDGDTAGDDDSIQS